MPTSLHQNSKSDTILLHDPPIADPWIDYGPARTNLADQTTYVEEVPSARAAVGGPRNIALKLTIRPGWEGTLIELGDGVDYSYQIKILADELYFAEEGILRVRLTPPDLVDAYTYLINWSQRTDGSNVIDDVGVGNLDTGAWEFGTDTHAASTPDPAHDLTIAAGNGGANPYDGTISVFFGVHIGRRVHAPPEAITNLRHHVPPQRR